MSKKQRDKKRLARIKAQTEKRQQIATDKQEQGKSVGRNAPCPCGSGKKYKNCCLQKETERLQQFNPFAREKDPEDDVYFEDAMVDDDDMAQEERWLWGDDDDYDQEDYDEDYVEGEKCEDAGTFPAPPPIKTINKVSPEISAEENALVDAWWDTYKKIPRGEREADAVREHLETFLAEHPNLVENLGLQHEVLFELGAQYVREKRHSEYAELLLKFRREFSSTYLKSFGYYDGDLISYQIITGHKERIPEFLDNFKEYPSHDPDSLFKTLNFLMANNCQDIVIPFVRHVYHEICTSPDIIGGGQIMEPVVLSYMIAFLRSDVSIADTTTLSQQLREIKVPLNEQFYDPKFLKERILSIIGERSGWNIDDCPTNDDIFIRYDQICLNFMGFLHREKGKDWVAAQLYHTLVYRYLAEVIPKGKRPKKIFVFTENKLDRTLGILCRDLFSLEPTKFYGSLNALFYFADYLLLTQSISEESARQLQEWCSGFFKKTFQNVSATDFIAKAYAQFPM